MLLISVTEVHAETSGHPERLILAHYMPWFEANAAEKMWGWHWTMNSANPNQILPNGQRQIASHLYPRIGPYSSGDDAVLEYQLLTMKLAGIDGVIVDWYGLEDLHDYKSLHANTVKLVQQVRRLKMKFAVCYEDKTISNLTAAGKKTAGQVTAHATKEIQWLNEHWFGDKSYVQIDGLPVLLSFGFDGLNDQQWKKTLDGLGFEVAYFSEHRRRNGARGAFDWPVPKVGIKATERFYSLAEEWPASIPVAYPRFRDFYRQAGLHDSWGDIDDDHGKTFSKTLTMAMNSKAKIIEIATWNDWGEGTVIEPSAEFGTRDLEVTQELRRALWDENFPYNAKHLELPSRLLILRRAVAGKKADDTVASLDQIAQQLANGQTEQAAANINGLELSGKEKK